MSTGCILFLLFVRFVASHYGVCDFILVLFDDDVAEYQDYTSHDTVLQQVFGSGNMIDQASVDCYSQCSQINEEGIAYDGSQERLQEICLEVQFNDS